MFRRIGLHIIVIVTPLFSYATVAALSPPLVPLLSCLLDLGEQQGSVLGFLVLSLCALFVGDLIQFSGFKYSIFHILTTQIYISRADLSHTSDTHWKPLLG